MSAFTYADLIATVDGLTARKKTLGEQIGVLATCDRPGLLDE
jgi:hypothetical protein